MAKLSTNTLGRKSIALLVLVAFVITSIVWNPAQGFGETVGPDLADIFRAAPQQPDRLSGLPPEIGTIQRLDGGWRMEDGVFGFAPSAFRLPPS